MTTKYTVLVNGGTEGFGLENLADIVPQLEKHLVGLGERQVTMRIDAVLDRNKRADGVIEKDAPLRKGNRVEQIAKAAKEPDAEVAVRKAAPRKHR